MLATVVAQAAVADDFPYLARTPANATKAALEKAGLSVDDIDLFEINEAFASVALNSMRMLGVDESKVNVNGGAIALGHPIGASGGRILGSLVHELRRRGGGLGVAAICSGGGQGDAIITSGGRVLGVTASGPNLKDCLSTAYEATAKIRFEGMHYRTDIGAAAGQTARSARD